MNYRHMYHAGNFSDVVKHVILISLIEALKQKDKPFCYLETHAGAGLYDLQTIEADKTQEYRNGILRIFTKANDSKDKDTKHKSNTSMPKLINTYLDIAVAYGFPKTYPGSPLIAQTCLRPTDSMILMELHLEEMKALKHIFRNGSCKNIAIHHQDGYLGMKAFLPPKEKRGLILIDPPFEKTNEWEQIISTVQMGLKRFPSGVYAIWYPLKDNTAVNQFHQQLKTLEVEERVVVELSVYPDDIAFGLTGCGMAIINPPWQWSKSIEEMIPWLWQVLANDGQGRYKVFDIKTS